MPHACHRVWKNATKPSRFAHVWEGAQSLAPATRSEIWMSKSGPYVVFCTFWLRNVLRATTVCTFSTSQLPKVVWAWCVCTFWLRHVLRATTACTFSTSQLPKAVRTWGVLAFSLTNVLRTTTACTFSSLIWPDGSAPAALASLLFDPPEPQIIRKTQCFATFLPFRAPVSSYFWLFLFSDLLSSLLSASAHLCFSSVHIVGSLTSKLPSNKKRKMHIVNGLKRSIISCTWHLTSSNIK